MKRSKFSLSHYKILSADMGHLVPIGLTEVLPGDTFQANTSLLVRVSPLLAPVMHPVHIRVHHWFVPHRLVFEDWEDFITGGEDGMDATVFPTMDLSEAITAPGTLADYLGVPQAVGGTPLTVSALPFRGYAMIWNEFYRDQDLQNELTVELGPGNDGQTNRNLQNVAWEKDYFTSARPWTQKGPAVSIPLVGDAPVRGIGVYMSAGAGVSDVSVNETHRGPNTTYPFGMPTSAATSGIIQTSTLQGGDPLVYADMASVAGVQINELRTALALQRYQEARAQFGSRYTEYLAYLGIRSSDARLQRPEYLGGGRQTIQFSEVLQTGPDDPDGGQIVGGLKGHGIGALRSNRYRRFFEEHGYIFTLMSVLPKTMYTQGLSRHWNRRVKEDFHQRELEHIGQQEVLNKELYAIHTTPDGVFGYQDRYDEYRRTESTIAGEFRTTELDFWHMARQFSAPPVLNASFVSSNPTKRINAVQTNHVLWVMANHNIKARRMLSKIARPHIF